MYGKTPAAVTNIFAEIAKDSLEKVLECIVIVRLNLKLYPVLMYVESTDIATQ